MKIPRIALRDVEYKNAVRELDAWVRSVTNALNNGVLLKDQLKADIKEVVFTTGTALTVKTTLAQAPATVICLRAAKAQSESSYQSGNAVTWTYANGFVSIESISGLDASTDYAVTLALVEG